MECSKCGGKMELDNQVGIWYCLDCDHQEDDREELHDNDPYHEFSETN